MTTCTSERFSAPGERPHDEGIYRQGLQHWRMDRKHLALATWERMSAGGRSRLGRALDVARLHVALDLAGRGRHGEAAEVLAGVSSVDVGVFRVIRSVALGCVRDGQARLAARIATHLGASPLPVDRYLHAAWCLSGEPRSAALAALAADRRAGPEVRGLALRRKAADLALEGRLDEARRTLAGSTARSSDLLLRALLDCVVEGSPPAQAACDWARMADVVGEHADLWGMLVGNPATSDPLEEAAWYLFRADPERAAPCLARALVERPWDPAVVRSFAINAFVRASRTPLPASEPIWRACLAAFAAFLENPRWLGAWLLERVGVYGVEEEDDRARAVELRTEAERFLDRRLTSLESAARIAGDETGVRQVRSLKALFSGEKRAAAALFACGAFPGPDGEKLAFGPVFADLAGVGDALRLRMGALKETPGAAGRSRLLEMLRAAGIDEEGTRRLLEGEKSDVVAEARRWFSELGPGSAMAAEGAWRDARDAAFSVWVRTTTEAGSEGFGSANPGFASLPDGRRRLREEAASMVCEMELAAFREEMTSLEFPLATVGDRIRRLLELGEAFGREGDVKGRISRIIAGKAEALRRNDDLRSLEQACELFRRASTAGIGGLGRPRGHMLYVLGNRFRVRRQYARGVECYLEAIEADPEEPTLATNVVGLLLEQYEQLKQAGSQEEARQVLQRAEAQADSVAQRFAGHPIISSLPMAVRAVRFGKPVKDIVTEPEGAVKPPEIPPPPAEVIECARRCLAARGAGDAATAYREAEKALCAAPEHPTAVVLFVQASLEQARAVGGEVGRQIWSRAMDAMRPSFARYKGYLRLEQARAMLDRDRVLHYHDSPVEELHRYALDRFHAEDWAAAVAAIKVVHAMDSRPSPEILSLYARSLAERLVRVDAPGEVGKGLPALECLIGAWREATPDHPELDLALERVAVARRRVGGR